MLAAKIIFWSSLFLIFWTYLGYYFLLYVVSMFHRQPSQADNYIPDISMIITAFNEQKLISRKLENSLSLDYPAERLEIIVASDGSTDCTEDIVRSFENKGVKLVSIFGHHGKHYCQGKAIEQARGEIIVLTDATTYLEHDSLKKMVRNFADPKIGCVSGIDMVQYGNGSGEGAYVKYEMNLRHLEGLAGSLVSASGSFYAIRNCLCREWYPDMSADFYLPILSFKNGYRSILEPEAAGLYEVLNDPGAEFRRKVRTVVHGLDVLFKFKYILNPFRYGFFSIQLLSHKLIRWMVPFLLILILMSNVILAPHAIFYRIVLTGQVLFYAAAGVSFTIKRLQFFGLFKIAFFFSLVNFSILVAWERYISGHRYVTWESTKR